MALTFTGADLNIALDTRTDLDVTDMYSRWKDWVKIGDNAKFPPAFRSTGGDEIVTGISQIPHYAFLLNEWRISPDENDYTLNVITGILLVDGGGDPFLDTVGAYTVRINYQQPVQGIALGLQDPYDDVTIPQAIRAMFDAIAAGDVVPPGLLPGTLKIQKRGSSASRIEATVAADGTRTVTAEDLD
jgi:hypothetical protein